MSDVIELPVPIQVRPLYEVVEEVERKCILEALRKFGGDKTKAAAALKVDRKTLYRRLERYEIKVIKSTTAEIKEAT